MRLRNKKTGEIIKNAYVRESHDFVNKRTIAVFVRDGKRPPERVSTGYSSLAELNEEWEDYEEPKEYWHIFGTNITHTREGDDELYDKKNKEIGNYFGTKEEAEKTVEKLKALERLKEKRFKFTAWRNGILLDKTVAGQVRYEFPIDNKDDIEKDLDLLFGGEE